MPESARAAGRGRTSVDDTGRGAAKKEAERKEGIKSVDVSYRAAASSKKEAGRKEATAKMKEAPKQATAIKEAQKNAPARESENSPPKTQSHQLKTDVESCGRLFRPWPSTKITVTVNPLRPPVRNPAAWGRLCMRVPLSLLTHVPLRYGSIRFAGHAVYLPEEHPIGLLLPGCGTYRQTCRQTAEPGTYRVSVRSSEEHVLDRVSTRSGLEDVEVSTTSGSH